MMRPSHLILHAVAALLLGFLGWSVFQPIPGILPAGTASPAIESTSHFRPSIPQGSPCFTHVTADRVLVPGQRLTVQGSLRGGKAGEALKLSLEGPDGSVASLELPPSPTEESRFTLQHPTPALGPGLYSWKLRLSPHTEPIVLGAQVLAPTLPRLLILLDFPSVEGARLHSWLSAGGSSAIIRTRVSADRYRLTSSPDLTNDLARLDLPTLARFDVVIAHESALDRLPPDEQTSLEVAIRQYGIGLLIFGPLPADPESTARTSPRSGEESTRPLSRKLRLHRGPDATAEARPTRVHLATGFSPETPVSIEPVQMEVPIAGRILVRDSLDRAVVVSAPLGQGRWLRSLVLDSWRWRQQGASEDYSRFWSTLLTEAARPIVASRPAMEGAAPSAQTPQEQGAWGFGEGSGLLFVDHPISLLRFGAPESPLPPAEVRSGNSSSNSPLVLNLHRHPSEPSRSTAIYWPPQPGWHTVRTLPDGPKLGFYVHSPGSLPIDPRGGARSVVPSSPSTTDRIPSSSASQPPSSDRNAWPQSLAFLLFVATVSRLWIDTRRGLGPAPESGGTRQNSVP